MKKQRKWAIGILLCIVAVVLAVWIGAAKDEKDGDRESLYENVDYGLGFWMPQGYTENPFYISDMETVGNGLMVEFFAPEADNFACTSGITAPPSLPLIPPHKTWHPIRTDSLRHVSAESPLPPLHHVSC